MLQGRGLFTEEWWRWLGVGVLVAYAILLNIAVLLAQTFLNREPPPACQCSALCLAVWPSLPRALRLEGGSCCTAHALSGGSAKVQLVSASLQTGSNSECADCTYVAPESPAIGSSVCLWPGVRPVCHNI